MTSLCDCCRAGTCAVRHMAARGGRLRVTREMPSVPSLETVASRVGVAGLADDRPGLVVLTIEMEAALPLTPHATAPAKLTSPYRAPLTKYLCVYADKAIAYFLNPTRMTVRALAATGPPAALPVQCLWYRGECSGSRDHRCLLSPSPGGVPCTRQRASVSTTASLRRVDPASASTTSISNCPQSDLT